MRRLPPRITMLCFGCMLIAESGCVTTHTLSYARMNEARRLIDEGAWRLRVGEISNAEAAFRLSEQVAPSAAALDGLGCAALIRGEMERAEALFRSAMQRDRTYSRAEANLALLHDLRGDRDEALLRYKNALREEPEDQSARNNYAAFLIEDENERAFGIELLREAQAVRDHPLVSRNLERVKEFE